ncbi:hypothetical protein DUNSADRAFT_11896 [Dunaliella salina]|uniref:Uncharacterized protein n=1 Tax=Dunaliella salina TaxID=3046 RepID=A0ABQ7H4A8_DUNSA|nr:hypothetical protein DUNSADRAFT_11896 [Dunaliella salina]|eukprot:KAF5841689.1 hypothetical protein DUNSADRAFT_11896 [Dunaliella salina]
MGLPSIHLAESPGHPDKKCLLVEFSAHFCTHTAHSTAPACLRHSPPPHKAHLMGPSCLQCNPFDVILSLSHYATLSLTSPCL